MTSVHIHTLHLNTVGMSVNRHNAHVHDHMPYRVLVLMTRSGPIDSLEVF